MVSGVSRQQGWQRRVALMAVAALVVWSAGGCGYGGGAWGWRSSAIRGAPPQHNRPCSKSGRSVHSDSSISLNLISLSLCLEIQPLSLFGLTIARQVIQPRRCGFDWNHGHRDRWPGEPLTPDSNLLIQQQQQKQEQIFYCLWYRHMYFLTRVQSSVNHVVLSNLNLNQYFFTIKIK